ncbi:MAG: hypothetical protein LBQ27_05145 [Clostridiales bacterium]|nr:hypothetical protein [Clostridiales bacterium]
MEEKQNETTEERTGINNNLQTTVVSVRKNAGKSISTKILKGAFGFLKLSLAVMIIALALSMLYIIVLIVLALIDTSLAIAVNEAVMTAIICFVDILKIILNLFNK